MQFVRSEIDPVAGLGMARRHVELFDGLDGGMEGRGIIAIRDTDVISTEQGYKKLEFTQINESGNGQGNRDIIHGEPGVGRDGEDQGSWMRKGNIKSRLNIKEIQRAEVRRSGSIGRSKDSGHARRSRVGARLSGRAAREALELVRGEQMVKVGGIILGGIGAF